MSTMMSQRGIVPTFLSIPYAGIAIRMLENQLTTEEEMAIKWLTNHLCGNTAQINIERLHLEEVSVHFLYNELLFVPIVEELLWELGVPLRDKAEYKERVKGNLKITAVALYYKVI